MGHDRIEWVDLGGKSCSIEFRVLDNIVGESTLKGRNYSFSCEVRGEIMSL
jgi:hypothetical protein